MSRQGPTRYRESISFAGLTVCLVFLLSLSLGLSPAHGAATATDPGITTGEGFPKAEKPADETSLAPVTVKEKPSDEYGDVTEETATSGEGPTIADPIEPWNRAMYHFNDKFYFWLLKPTAQGYKYVIPETFRIIFSNFYENIMMPVRFVNNLLQGKPDYAGRELVRFVINSTVGVAGFRDVAKDGFEITGRKADFGQTLGKYGIGSGFYIVWPILGPSNPRDTVGWVGDLFLKPTTYLSSEWLDPELIAITAHEKVNYFSFHIGDYETLKKAAIDPYIAMRDAYVQYRKKLLEQ
jgi:phospholipid-binding lipoprotein MlaA